MKPKSKLFTPELLPGEEILWIGQPEARVLFTPYDLYLIPFSLFWCAIVSTFWVGGQFGLFILPHTIIGLYMLFGRFIYKYWRKSNTFYAVTNRRILILTRLLNENFQSLDIHQLPMLERSHARLSPTGSIKFGTVRKPKSRWLNHRQTPANVGLDLFNSADTAAFFDLRDVDEVYRLINGLRYDVPLQQESGEEPEWSAELSNSRRIG